MRVTRITTNLQVNDIDAARSFYADFLGLTVGFDLGWVVNFHPPDNEAMGVQLVTKDATAPVDSQISVGVSNVHEAYELAQRKNYEIVHPLTHEAWGVRRFFVRSPQGVVVNIVQHE
jgi:catechol 2,3-dioxygenase-like lactoylglutathione lyase family enzyme